MVGIQTNHGIMTGTRDFYRSTFGSRARYGHIPHPHPPDTMAFLKPNKRSLEEEDDEAEDYNREQNARENADRPPILRKAGVQLTARSKAHAEAMETHCGCKCRDEQKSSERAKQAMVMANGWDEQAGGGVESGDHCLHTEALYVFKVRRMVLGVNGGSLCKLPPQDRKGAVGHRPSPMPTLLGRCGRQVPRARHRYHAGNGGNGIHLQQRQEKQQLPGHRSATHWQRGPQLRFLAANGLLQRQLRWYGKQVTTAPTAGIPHSSPPLQSWSLTIGTQCCSSHRLGTNTVLTPGPVETTAWSTSMPSFDLVAQYEVGLVKLLKPTGLRHSRSRSIKRGGESARKTPTPPC